MRPGERRQQLRQRLGHQHQPLVVAAGAHDQHLTLQQQARPHLDTPTHPAKRPDATPTHRPSPKKRKQKENEPFRWRSRFLPTLFLFFSSPGHAHPPKAAPTQSNATPTPVAKRHTPTPRKRAIPMAFMVLFFNLISFLFFNWPRPPTQSPAHVAKKQHRRRRRAIQMAVFGFCQLSFIS